MEDLKTLKTEPVSEDEAVDCLSGEGGFVDPLLPTPNIKTESHPASEDIETEDNDESHLDLEHEPEAVHLVVPKFELEYLEKDEHQEIHFEKKEVKLECYPEAATEVSFQEEDYVRTQDLTLQKSEPVYQDNNIQETSQGLNEQHNDTGLQCEVSMQGKQIPSKQMKCSVCFKEFRHLCELKRHFLIHSEKKFSCNVCSKTFAQRCNVKEHMLIHNRNRLYECTICNKKFVRRSHLNDHSVTHTGERKFSCLSCPRRFAYKSNLLSHQVVHTKEKNFTCDVCGRQFYRRSHLKKHVMGNCGKKFRCPKCPKGFSEADKLNLHASLHSRQMKFRCLMCDTRFTLKSSLKRHIEKSCNKRTLISASNGVRAQDLTLQKSEPVYQDHDIQETSQGLNEQQINDIRLQYKGSIKVKRVPRKQMKCLVCFSEFRHLCELKRHLLIHSEKKFSCEVCSKKFAQHNNLKSHMLIHTGDRSFECMICNRKFVRRSHLKEHLVTHTGERKYSCPSCSRRFAYRTNLLSHQVVHTKEKKYTCDVCRRQFFRRSHLKAHLTANCGLKFCCPKCPKRFSEADKLNLHAALHTKQMKFCCSMCETRFTLKSSLKRHIEKRCIRRAVTTTSDG